MDKLYTVTLIHRVHDWDAVLQFRAPSARKARQWAPSMLAHPGSWLITGARQCKP